MATVQQPGIIPSLTVGNRVFTDLTNLITLIGLSQGVGGSYSSGRLPNTSAGYAVPAGKQLRIVGVSCHCVTAGPIAFGYADNDCGSSSNTTPTNPVYPASNIYAAQIQMATAGNYYERNVNFVVPAGKYVAIHGSNSVSVGNMLVYGYLESV